MARMARGGSDEDLVGEGAPADIRERCTSRNSSYYSYELNLVLDDGSRLNGVDHGNLERLRAA